MKQHIIFLLLFTAITMLTQAQQDSTQILFIGNSITYYNDMPHTVEQIANAQGQPTKVTVYAPGGTGFIHHVNDPKVYAHFRQGKWDYVVLQPGSKESPGYSEPIEATTKRAQQLKDSIVRYNPCAKVLFYEISYGVWGNTPENIATYNATMDLIRANITTLSDSTASFMAAAGEAIRTAWNADPSTLLWGSAGDIHPNAKGSYIIACSFYASIFQQASVGSPITAGLSPSEALAYQTLADTTVLNHLSNWRINTYYQHAFFSFQQDGNTVIFKNLSTNTDSQTWYFGDGNSSTNNNPTHHYAADGNYTVTLKTYKNSCTDSIQRHIQISTLNTNETALQRLKIYPNPTNNILHIEGSNIHNNKIRLYNSLGQIIETRTPTYTTTTGFDIQLSALPQGMYIIEIGQEKRKVNKL